MSGPPRAGSKVGRDIQRRLARLGYTLQHRGDGKHIVVDAAGTPVRKPNGVPVALPNSPSDHRAYKNLRSVLRHAGIDIEEEQ